MEQSDKKAECVVCDSERMKEHYATLLARRYSWVYGGFDKKAAEASDIFTSLGVETSKGELAFDLGSGPGFQSVPLAQRGYQVVAIDLSEELLTELSTHAAGLPIRSVQDDFVEYLKQSDEKAGIIVCMGDTITHLESIDRVNECISQCARHLLPGGKIILT
ncbi:MAG TPA: class I SAM-dependent methyltransferase, partial [Spirochaetota bacterium]